MGSAANKKGYNRLYMRSKISIALLLNLCLLLGGQIWQVQAQDTSSQGSTVTSDQVNAVARDLWCPLCSGVRLDACELQACTQMRQEIALKLDAGQDAASIKQDFLDQYGPQVLGEPPRSGFNWLAWILPFVGLLGGAIFLLLRGRRLLFSPAPANPERRTATMPSVAQPDDPYARQLDEELKRYD